jgi:exodeoxyribonuclease III
LANPAGLMRIATWNVNSLKARLDRVEEWLGIAAPDVLLMQETKLADEMAPVMPFAMAGYELAHHGEGRWNGVAIASRVGITDVVTNFGDGPVVTPGVGAGGGSRDEAADPADDGLGPEARMISARCGPIRVVSIYAPNGRALDTPFYAGKLAWFERLSRWLEETQDPADDILIGGDFNVAPDDLDVYDPGAYVGATHVSPPERDALARLRAWGLLDVVRPFHPEAGFYTWWDYRAGNFHKNLGMRIDHLYASRSVAARVVAAERDRDARKGKLPSDHAPLYVDLAS